MTLKLKTEDEVDAILGGCPHVTNPVGDEVVVRLILQPLGETAPPALALACCGNCALIAARLVYAVRTGSGVFGGPVKKGSA